MAEDRLRHISAVLSSMLLRQEKLLGEIQNLSKSIDAMASEHHAYKRRSEKPQQAP
jgi:hypothetical protein